MSFKVIGKKIILSIFIFITIVLVSCSKPQNEYCFENQDKQLISVIDSAKSNLDIAIYSLTKKDIVDSIIKAKKRKVKVRIITDNIESKTKSESEQLERLKKAEIPIKVNTHKGLMHLKLTIADKDNVTTGSYNYTNNATFDNDEVLVIIHGSNKEFEKKFTDMWNDDKGFKDY